MVKYDIVLYQKDHFYSLRFREDLRPLAGLADADQAKILAEGGPTYSAFADSKIIGIGGVFMLWKGVGEAWVLVSPEVEKHGVFLIRACRRYIDMIAKTKNLVRIQAAVQVDYEAHLKFVEAMGFEAEGVMVKYFAGKTFIRFAKIYEEDDHGRRNNL